MKVFVHARLGKAERIMLEQLKRATGHTESQIVRRGLQLVAKEEGRRRTALDLSGRSVGRFTGGPRDLSANRRHLDGFGR
jgi:imidazoleglycerol phosphate dehydratase HisB